MAQQPPVPAANVANDELAVLRQRLEDETRRRQEAEQQLAALTAPPAATPAAPKRKKKKRCILDDSESDSDGGEDGEAARVSVSQSPPRQLVKKRRAILEDDDLFAFRRVDPDALSRRESNAFVQKVLDAYRFRFTLLDHQYEAARGVAGLPYLWPRTLVNDRADDTLEQAPLTADRHLILADQMGLGKTVMMMCPLDALEHERVLGLVQGLVERLVEGLVVEHGLGRGRVHVSRVELLHDPHATRELGRVGQPALDFASDVVGEPVRLACELRQHLVCRPPGREHLDQQRGEIGVLVAHGDPPEPGARASCARRIQSTRSSSSA